MKINDSIIIKIIPIIEANILSKYKITENKWNFLKLLNIVFCLYQNSINLHYVI